MPSSDDNGPRRRVRADGGERPARGGGRAGRSPARSAGERPPRAPRRSVRKPALPDERPRVPRGVYQDLRGSVPSPLLDDVIRAYGAAGEALERGDERGAAGYLEWAKSVAPRSAALREALGVVRYRLEEFAEAAAELAAYRRMSGREDQNHLLADCARAAGRPEKVEEYVRAMQDARNVPRDRLVEGLIVLAGARADHGDPRAALDVLDRIDLRPDRVEVWHPRVWYAAADFAERVGDTAAVRDYLEAVVSVDEDFLDAAERLAALEGEGGE